MIGRIIKVFVFLLMLSAMGGALYKFYFEENSSKQDRGHFTTSKVVKQDITKRVSFSGKVFPMRSSNINPPFEGYVKHIYVSVGDRVKKNDPLISVIDNPNVDSKEVYPIRASFPGTVVQVNVAEGQNVSKDRGSDVTNAMIRVDDLSQMFIQAEVPEIEYVNIKVAQEAIIKAPAIFERSYKGKVLEKSMAPVAQDRWSRNTVVFPIKVEVTDADSELKSGMSVLVDIVVAEKKQVLALKHEFVENNEGKYFVKTAKGSRVPIKIGIQDDVYVEILEGLTLGEEIQQVDFLHE